MASVQATDYNDGYPGLALMTLLDADKNLTCKHNDPNAVGEDTWELFESIEQSFGICLGDFESLAGIRISELAEKVCKLANYPAKEKCVSAVAFYKLRQAFVGLYGVPLRSIAPSTPVRQIMPWRSRRAKWRAMQEHLDLQFPQLAFPGWLLLLCLTIPAGLLIFAKESIGLEINWVAVIACSLMLDVGAMYVCVPLARSLPRGCETFGDLAKAVLARNYAAFAKSNAGSSEEDMLSSLRLLVASHTDIEAGKILPETRIPSDLNIY